MRKQLWLFSVVLAFALVAAACGDDDDASTDTTAGTETTAATTAAPAEDAANVGLVYDIGGRGDQSFNDSAAAGFDQAIADFGINGSEASANNDGSNREELLNLQADQSDLVFGIGFLFGDPMLAAATANPDTSFGIVDGFIEDAPDNVAMLLFAEEQGSFLVGVAAALMCEAGLVDFMGGLKLEFIHIFDAGFVAGVQAVDESIVIDRQYITEPPDFNGFNDPASGKVIGQSMFEGGADVVYHAAGGSGNGLFQAAKEYSEAEGTKVWAIGVDSDQYLTASPDVQEYILTSMLKRVDVSVYNTIEEQVDGSFAGGVKVFDLSVDGVGYSTTGGFVDDIVSELDAWKDKIVSGEVVVPSVP
jgi:basic membrane protein A